MTPGAHGVTRAGQSVENEDRSQRPQDHVRKRISVAPLSPWRPSRAPKQPGVVERAWVQSQTSLVQILALSFTRSVTLRKLQYLPFLSLSVLIYKVVIKC